MAVISEKELPATSRPLWLKGNERHRNAQLRIRDFADPSHPQGIAEFPRRQAVAPARRTGHLQKEGGIYECLSGGSIQAMKSQGLIKKDPQAAILAAEEIMEKDPHNIGANSLLRDAAAAAGMIETVGFALETMCDAEPKNVKFMHELAKHYSASDQAEKAIEVYNRISAINPADIEAIKGGKGRGGARVDAFRWLGSTGQGGDELPRRTEECRRGKVARTAEPHHQERGHDRAAARGEFCTLQRESQRPQRGPPDRRSLREERRFGERRFVLPLGRGIDQERRPGIGPQGQRPVDEKPRPHDRRARTLAGRPQRERRSGRGSARDRDTRDG